LQIPITDCYGSIAPVFYYVQLRETHKDRNNDLRDITSSGRSDPQWGNPRSRPTDAVPPQPERRSVGGVYSSRHGGCRVLTWLCPKQC